MLGCLAMLAGHSNVAAIASSRICCPVRQIVVEDCPICNLQRSILLGNYCLSARHWLVG